MPDMLLLGAGFSRNWGGWLASEAFEYLLGCPEIVNDNDLRQRLWKHQPHGGFEAALADLQVAYSQNQVAGGPPLMALQSAVMQMFTDMNNAFLASTDWQLGQQCIDRQIGTFLTRFDAIFTLNQDVLLEHHYVNDNIKLIGKKKFAGAELPGMKRTPHQEPLYSESWARSTWTPAEDSFEADASLQPIYKLHGSSNWTRADGQSMLIMGGAKVREIGDTPILNWYAKVFDDLLTTKGAKLMVIGYGFRDNHINEAIAKAVEGGLKLFIIAPEGAALARQINSTRQGGQIAAATSLEGVLEQSLIGASRRSLGEIFGRDTAEFNKVMRFFEA
jgi:hypothetical protein